MTAAAWPQLRMLSAEFPSEVFVLEHTSPVDGGITLYPLRSKETALSTTPSTILPPTCFSCLGGSIEFFSETDTAAFAKSLVQIGNCSANNHTLSLDEATLRVKRATRRPNEAFETGNNKTLMDFPKIVRDAAIAYYVTNDTNILREMDLPDDVSIHFRKQSPEYCEDGSWCIIVQESDGVDGPITEFYLRPNQTNIFWPFMRIVQVERSFVPINWSKMAKESRSHAILLVLGMLSAFCNKIPNFGFGTTKTFRNCKNALLFRCQYVDFLSPSYRK